jgi:hypothetical protein
MLLPPPPPGTPGPFALSEDGRVESSMANAGLKLVFAEKVPCSFLYHNLQEGIMSFMGTGPAAAGINNSNVQTVEKVIANALQQFRLADDMYFLQNQFLLFIGEK